MKEIIEIESIDKFIEDNYITLGYFSTEYCSVCKALKPKIVAIADSYKQVEMFYSGIDKNQELSGKFMVFTVPTIILFIEGKEHKRFARYVSTNEIRESIERYLEIAG